MDASAYSLISIGSRISTSGDSEYLNQHHTQLDNHLHHPLQHHQSLSNLFNEDEDLEHDYHLHSHHSHHLPSHNHNHGHQLRHSSSPYGLDHLLTDGCQSLMAVDSCELMGLGSSDDDDDLQGTLTSFVCTDLGAESDTGYTSGVDGYFNHSSTSLIDQCGSSDSQDAYCFRPFSLDSSLVSGCGTDTSGVHDGTSPLLMCQQSNNNNNNLTNNLNDLGDFNQNDNQSIVTSFSSCSYVGGDGSSTSSSICSPSNYSDIINNSSDYYTSTSSSNYYNDCTQPTSDMTCQGQQVVPHNSQQRNNHSMGPIQQNHGQSSTSSVIKTGQTKRSVLMNLLIDGSDIGAGYTSINSRALQSIN